VGKDMPTFSATVPQVKISAWRTHEETSKSGRYQDCSCELTKIDDLVTSIGTYIDSPYHFHPSRAKVGELSLQQLVLPGIVIDASEVPQEKPIPTTLFETADIAGKAVLIYTGRDELWGTPAYSQHPFLPRETALMLRDRGAKLVGIDVLTIDTMKDPTRPAHVNLLGADIVICENMRNLKQLLGCGDFLFHAVPPKIENCAAFPVRAFAMVWLD